MHIPSNIGLFQHNNGSDALIPGVKRTSFKTRKSDLLRTMEVWCHYPKQQTSWGPERLQTAPRSQVLVKAHVQTRRGEKDRVILSQPPRHGGSIEKAGAQQQEQTVNPKAPLKPVERTY